MSEVDVGFAGPGGFGDGAADFDIDAGGADEGVELGGKTLESFEVEFGRVEVEVEFTFEGVDVLIEPFFDDEREGAFDGEEWAAWFFEEAVEGEEVVVGVEGEDEVGGGEVGEVSVLDAVGFDEAVELWFGEGAGEFDGGLDFSSDGRREFDPLAEIVGVEFVGGEGEIEGFVVEEELVEVFGFEGSGEGSGGVEDALVLVGKVEGFDVGEALDPSG